MYGTYNTMVSQMNIQCTMAKHIHLYIDEHGVSNPREQPKSPALIVKVIRAARGQFGQTSLDLSASPYEVSRSLCEAYQIPEDAKNLYDAARYIQYCRGAGKKRRLSFEAFLKKMGNVDVPAGTVKNSVPSPFMGNKPSLNSLALNRVLPTLEVCLRVHDGNISDTKLHAKIDSKRVCSAVFCPAFDLDTGKYEHMP